MLSKILLFKAGEYLLKNANKIFKKIAKTFVQFMKNLTGWLLKAVKKVEDYLGIEVQGTKIFLKHAHEMFKEISKHYSVDERGQWHETTVTKEVPASEVPADIRRKAEQKSNKEITNDVENNLKELELAV